MARRSQTRQQHLGTEVLHVKIATRLATLPPAEPGRRVRILDAYAGEGDIWRAVREHRPDVVVVPVERRPGLAEGNVTADNLRVLAGIDLTHFDGVDLDAWGMPIDQMCMLAERGWHGPVWWTAILVGVGPIPHKALALNGLPKHWDRVLRVLTDWPPLWFGALGALGYRKVAYANAPKGGASHLYGVVGYDRFDADVYEAYLTDRLGPALWQPRLELLPVPAPPPPPKSKSRR